MKKLNIRQNYTYKTANKYKVFKVHFENCLIFDIFQNIIVNNEVKDDRKRKIYRKN